METISLKALSIKHLQRNNQVNIRETDAIHKEFKNAGCISALSFTEAEARTLLRELIRDLDQHTWPETGLDLPSFSEIDRAFMAGDMEALMVAANNYRCRALAALDHYNRRKGLWQSA